MKPTIVLRNSVDNMTVVFFGHEDSTGYDKYGIVLPDGTTVKIDLDMDTDSIDGYAELNITLGGIRLSNLSRHTHDPEDCWKSFNSGYDLTQLEQTVAYAMSDVLGISRVPAECLASEDNKNPHWVI